MHGKGDSLLSVRLCGNTLQRAKHDLGVETELVPELTQNWETFELQPAQLVFAEHPGETPETPTFVGELTLLGLQATQKPLWQSSKG